MEKVIFFDTTLRDGEQSPGVSLNVKDKIIIAKQLEALGVDYIEAGFPIASKGDFEGVKEVANLITNSSVCGLARANYKDIEVCYEAVKGSKKPRIHTFIATSPIHMKHKLKMSEDEVLKRVESTVSYASKLIKDIEFSAEDAFRSDLDFLIKVFKIAIKNGATTINVPDTVGYATPVEFGKFIGNIKNAIGDSAIISVHCHNDLGLAVANSLQAIENGATQIECTVNGIGERAGNASLEELAVALYTRQKLIKKSSEINLREIYKTSKLVSDMTGMLIQPNKAIVGKNAFLHESGIHQDGVLKERETYEIINPHDIGINVHNIVLGKHSGRHAFKNYIEDWGYFLDDESLQKAFEDFKSLCDLKKEIFDDDIIEIVSGNLRDVRKKYELSHLQIVTGSNLTSTATVGIVVEGNVVEKAQIGHGPVDAIYAAINEISEYEGKLLEYKINAVTGGRDAQGSVYVKVIVNGRVFSGKGVSVDILQSSAKAYIDSINKAYSYFDMGGNKDGNDNHRENIG